MTIPSNLRVPLFAVEFDNSQANQGPAQLAYLAMLLGQKTNSGTGTADTVYDVTSADQVRVLAGRGSLAHRMAIKWFKINKFTKTRVAILADNGAGTAATGTVAITGTATAAGTLTFR